MDFNYTTAGALGHESISQRRALSISECSKESGLSENFLRNDVNLPKRKFGRRTLILAADWQKYLENGSNGGKNASQN